MQKVQIFDCGLDPAPHADQSPSCPPAHSGGIGQARGIPAVRCGLLGGIAGGDPLARLLPAVKAVVPAWSQPIRQNRESLPARLTESPPHPDAFVLVIVALASAPPVADDRVIKANGASPREKFQGDYPGSALSSASGSAIKRITAGVKAAADRPCQVSI